MCAHAARLSSVCKHCVAVNAFMTRLHVYVGVCVYALYSAIYIYAKELSFKRATS